MNKEDSIKISPKPFIFIILLFVMFVIVGSTANYFRMKNRFDSLIDHSKVIYDAHKDDIENMFNKQENLPEIKSVLENINSPEKNVYFIDIIRNNNGSWVLYDDQVTGIIKLNVRQKDIDSIQNYISLDDNEKFAFQKNLRGLYENFYKPYPYYNDDFLISIIPINQNLMTVGYFITATSKVQDN